MEKLKTKEVAGYKRAVTGICPVFSWNISEVEKKKGDNTKYGSFSVIALCTMLH